MSENQPRLLVNPPKGLRRNITGLEPVLAERGRIKTGARGDKAPKHFQHFVITTMARNKDDYNNFVRDTALHKLLSERGCGDPLTEIPVRLLFNEVDLNLTTGYGVWEPKLKTWWCRGDGESAQRLNGQSRDWIECPCPLLGNKCKIQGRLRVVIDGAPGLGGVWTYITTSWHSVRAISASLTQLYIWTSGHMAGIPLQLVMRPKSVNVEGVATTIQVVNIEYRGDMEQLRLEAFNAAKLQIGYEKQLLQLEKELGAADVEIVPSEDGDEFYPDKPAPPPPLAQPDGPVPASDATDEESSPF